MMVVKPKVIIKPTTIENTKKKITLIFLKANHNIIVTKKRLKSPACDAPFATEEISS